MQNWGTLHNTQGCLVPNDPHVKCIDALHFAFRGGASSISRDSGAAALFAGGLVGRLGFGWKLTVDPWLGANLLAAALAARTPPRQRVNNFSGTGPKGHGRRRQ